MPDPIPLPSAPVSQPFRGVVTVEPGIIAASLKRQVESVLATIPEGKHGAMLAVATTRGVNLVFAYKLNRGWDTVAWVGRSGWDTPIEGGIGIRKTW